MKVDRSSLNHVSNKKIKIATTSLAGCFGCHMSLLDIDERLAELDALVVFDRSPLTDVKTLSGEIDVGLIEGGLCNSENVHLLREFRRHCKILVAVGACAINGGVPAIRNNIALVECLNTSYIDGQGVVNGKIPSDPELPLLLDQVYPLHAVVRIDYFLPGCPPSAENIWTFLSQLLSGYEPVLVNETVHFD